MKNVDKTVENNGISYMLFFCLPCRMERFRIDCGLHQPPDGTPANVCDRLQGHPHLAPDRLRGLQPRTGIHRLKGENTMLV